MFGTFFSASQWICQVWLVASCQLDFTSDDYGMVLEGAVESLPGMLHDLKYEDWKQDVSLVFKYLADCCAMSEENVF